MGERVGRLGDIWRKNGACKEVPVTCTYQLLFLGVGSVSPASPEDWNSPCRGASGLSPNVACPVGSHHAADHPQRRGVVWERRKLGPEHVLGINCCACLRLV